MDSRLKAPTVDSLFQAILLLKTQDDCYRFFEDLCTVSEIKSLAQRLEVAKKLDRGESYADIARETGASTATISRVKKYLHYGADGYRLILDKLAENGGRGNPSLAR